MDFATIERTSTLTSEEKQFLADLSDKSKILETFSDRIYRCPAMEPNGIWQIRILDPEKYYHSQEASVDFVLADPEVEVSIFPKNYNIRRLLLVIIFLVNSLLFLERAQRISMQHR